MDTIEFSSPLLLVSIKSVSDCARYSDRNSTEENMVFWLQVRTEQWEEAVDTIRQSIALQQESGFTTLTGRMVRHLLRLRRL